MSDIVRRIARSSIINNMAMSFWKGPPYVKLDDSYVHSVVSVIFKSVFQSDPVLSYQCYISRANGRSGGDNNKHKTIDNDGPSAKTDFVMFMVHSQSRADLAVSEVKSPSNAGSNNVTEPDMVKMEEKCSGCWRNSIGRVYDDNLQNGLKVSSELSSTELLKTIEDVSVLPSILRGILQIKYSSTNTHRRKRSAVAKPNGDPLMYSPRHSYMAKESFYLKRDSRKTTKLLRAQQDPH
ncbi:hypothetical protein BDA99DRAFT_531014 [Phascolomyces articulosus]|uniref:Uncharacterized protein n=1 Tax=Phascolomyces articulosus TaxID=60185 RepID=A0AAD5KPL4_9FUNG|nr:hypothetical protein BDA99DRAFT_531014 [Phascolomyces articulosus]